MTLINENKNEKSIYYKKIDEEMKSSYLSYAMSVIIGRALPDVRDGLKVVHRRILYSMNESGITFDKSCKKSARIVGDVLGKYHPHGDSSVYDAIVRMVQPFSLRYPLIYGQGNFGSIDGDSAAAMRYTEVKLQKISNEILEDINKNTVLFKGNYDNTIKEPVVLPSKLPNLLINGSMGIAVGMATNMPPHNLSEIVDGIIYYMYNKKNITIEKLMNIIKGPDFPTGGVILNEIGLKKAYMTGKGVIKIRGTYQVEEINDDKKRIIIKEIPYQVNKSKLIEEISYCVHEKIINGISDLRDESDRNGIRVVIEVNKGFNEELIINSLYKHTQFEISFGIINLAIVNSTPKILSLFDLIELYISYRLEIIQKRTEYELNISKSKIHILNGLKLASMNIIDIINIIKISKNIDFLKKELKERYDLDDIQIKSILELKLQKLMSIERDHIEEEISENIKKINEYNKILNSKIEKYDIIKGELLSLKEKYGDLRRSIILELKENKEKKIEEYIEKDDVIIILTNNGYIKRVPICTFEKQNIGGKGIIGIDINEHDSVRNTYLASTHDYILFFTNKGRVFLRRAYEIPNLTRISKGKSIVNILNLVDKELVTSLFIVNNLDSSSYLLLLTKKGYIKKILLSKFKNIRKNGIIAILLKENDELIDVKNLKGHENLIIATYFGRAICINESEINESNRLSRGGRGIKLKENDYTIGMVLINKNETLFIITENGFGKRTKYEEYNKKHKGTYGVKTIITNSRNGYVSRLLSVSENDELIITSSNGIIIRIEAIKINCFKRNTQGIKIMSLNKGDKISSVVKTNHF